ncbi:hypothetical protein [Streptomyces sp. NPDC001781]
MSSGRSPEREPVSAGAAALVTPAAFRAVGRRTPDPDMVPPRRR